MKRIKSVFPKGYCYHADVIVYALYAERGKAVMKRTNEVSKLVGVSRRTLQYYDDEGMLMVERSENNYRLYDEEVLERLWKIMIYKEMGLDLKKIKQLLLMSDAERNEYFRLRIKEIEDRISELKGQLEFISWILTQGMPQMPEESAGITYISRIAELRKKDVHE